MRRIKRHDFEDRDMLAEHLADNVASALSRGVEERGRATLAVSGGSTPARFLEALSNRTLAWDKVTITLVDERFVPETDERSNQRLLARHLLRGPAARAKVAPLYNDAPDVELAADRAAAVVATLPRPFDAIVLGMGTDGHIASLFPGGDNLAEALSLGAGPVVFPMNAPAADVPRLTLSLPVIIEARFLVLHIEGAEKKAALALAETEGREDDMPVRAVLRHAQTPVEIYWAP